MSMNFRSKRILNIGPLKEAFSQKSCIFRGFGQNFPEWTLF